MKKYDAIIFDLDGTLWDSSETVCSSWNAVIDQNNYNCPHIKPDELKALMGRPMMDFIRKFFPFANEDNGEKILDECSVSEIAYIKKYGGNLFEGVPEVLETLSEKYPLFIVSNCQDGYIEAFLEHHELEECFSGILCPGKNGPSKGRNILTICEKFNCKNAVYVGDTQTDADACEEAGVDFIFAGYGFGNPDKYVRKVESFYELGQIFIED